MRIVVKIGTSTLTHATGHLNIRRVAELRDLGAEQVCFKTGPFAPKDLRLILEPGIAELAAYNATDEEIEHLKDLCDTVEYKIDHDLYYIQDDIDFHTYIARCSKNKVVEQIISIIETAVLMFVNLTHRRLRQETIITHRAITKSIAEHDPVGARSAMTMHISYNRAAIKEIYDARNRELENQEQ